MVCILLKRQSLEVSQLLLPVAEASDRRIEAAHKSGRDGHSPPFLRRGARAIKPLEREGGAVIRESRSAPCFVEFTNRPVCAAKERGRLLMAQPPRLEKAGNVHFNHSLCKAIRRGVAGTNGFVKYVNALT